VTTHTPQQTQKHKLLFQMSENLPTALMISYSTFHIHREWHLKVMYNTAQNTDCYQLGILQMTTLNPLTHWRNWSWRISINKWTQITGPGFKPRTTSQPVRPPYVIWNVTQPTQSQVTTTVQRNFKLECGPMPNMMVALPNIGGAFCSTPQSLPDVHY